MPGPKQFVPAFAIEGLFERRRTARIRASSSSQTKGLPFEALFAARDALFGPILVAQSGELARRWSRRPGRDTIRRRSRPGAGPADWHLFTIDVEGAAFHDYDPQEDVHHVKKWTPARGYEASTRSITT
jgi:hypothetical protein